MKKKKAARQKKPTKKGASSRRGPRAATKTGRKRTSRTSQRKSKPDGNRGPQPPDFVAERDVAIRAIADGYARAWSGLNLKAEQVAFLAAFAHLRNISRSALFVGISRRTHVHWMQDDSYREAFAEATKDGDDSLIQAATRRARDGIDEPVYQMGSLVGFKRVYSDSLLQMLMKGAMPDTFKERTEHSGSVQMPAAAVRPLSKVPDDELAELERLAELPPDSLSASERLTLRLAERLQTTGS